MVAAFYGLRRGEVCRLKWDAIDFERSTITIKHTSTSIQVDGKTKMYAQDSAKTKSSMRTLPLVGSFAEYFREVKAAQERNKKVCDNCYNYEYDGRVFVDELGDLMKPHDLMGYFPPAYAKARFKAYAFSRSPPLSRKACAAALCRSPGRANAALRRFLSRPSNPSLFTGQNNRTPCFRVSCCFGAEGGIRTHVTFPPN